MVQGGLWGKGVCGVRGSTQPQLGKARPPAALPGEGWGTRSGVMVWLVPWPVGRQERMLPVTLPLLHLFPCCSSCYEGSNYINIAY